uniref:Uncharacterized protein n=1 Tax=Tanacetum cinerariifolium TaxID=118510 RepID=A0A6L2L1P8_TANCI|nr:hypothetical protein [Tanacetum cinerariifolium]
MNSCEVAARSGDIIPTVDMWCNGDGTGGGDECAYGAVHLARRSPAEGSDSEVSGDGGGVGMARNLSTSASGGRDMEA